MTGCNNHLHHSAFRLPAAAHDPRHAISISTRWCAGAGVHHVQCAALLFIWIQFSWCARRGVLGNMSHGHTIGNTSFYNHHIINLTDHPPSAHLQNCDSFCCIILTLNCYTHLQMLLHAVHQFLLSLDTNMGARIYLLLAVSSIVLSLDIVTSSWYSRAREVYRYRIKSDFLKYLIRKFLHPGRRR